MTYDEQRVGRDILDRPGDVRPHEPDLKPYLLLDPARGQLCLNCLPEGPTDDLATAAVAQVTHEARFAPPGVGPAQSLPLFGPLRPPGEGVPVGEIIALAGETPALRLQNRSGDSPGVATALAGGTPALPLMTVSQDGDACRLHFAGRIFETIGLYLSRFSWPGDPGWKRFVREIDDLWDGQLRERWGRQAVVNDYLQIIAGLLCQLCAQAGEPLVTVWPHPLRDGQVKRQGFLVSHDVDQLFADLALRVPLDQTDIPRFFLPRWR
ncbi:MAG: hypothetical protein Q7I92_05395, partial [Humidesulfovibrio sp.]|nr:hypothetical protein [Humidesulfovibrio sp.]